MIPTGGTIFSSTNTFMATMAPASAPAIRPAGAGWPLLLYSIFGRLDASSYLEAGKRGSFRREDTEAAAVHVA